MAISLGTIFGSVRIALAGLEEDAASIRATLAGIQGQFDQLATSTEETTQAMASAFVAPDDAITTLSADTEAATTAMTEGMDAAAEATQNLATASDELAASAQGSTDALVENTAAVTDNTAAKDASSNSTNGLAKQFTALRGPLLLAGLALAGVGVGALVVGSQYETAMSQVQALTGQSSAQMAQFNQQILTDAPKWGAAPKDLANGLYYVLSAGTPASQAMGELQVVTEASSASLVDAATDANALTTALNSYGKGAKDAMNYQDMLLTSVKDGKQQMSDLASSIGKAASMGSVAGVSFNQVAAAESTLTLTGDTARMASQSLYSLMQLLDLKTDALAKRAKALGVTFDENKFKTMGLYDQLQYLEKATGGNATKLSGLINNSAAFTGAVKLMTDKGSYFKNILDDMGRSSGMTASAFATHEKTMGASFDHLKASGQVALIHIQQALEPIVTSIVSHVLPALNRFSTWATTHGPELANDIKIVAVAFGLTLVTALGAATIAFIATNAAAVGISLAIMAIATGVALVIVNWPKITAFFQSSSAPALAIKAVLIGIGAALLAWGVTMIPAALGALAGLIPVLFTGAVAAWAFLAPILVAAAPFIAIGVAVAAVAFGIFELVTHWKQVTAFLIAVWSVVWHAIVGALQAAWHFIQGIWAGIVHGAQAFGAGVVNVLKAGFKIVVDVITFPIRFIVGLFEWLFNHNYYFHALVEYIVYEFNRLKAFIGVIWNFIKSFLALAWKDIQNVAKIAWLVFYNVVIKPVQQAWHEIQVIWNTVIAILKNVWSIITTDVTGAWNTFIGIIHTAVSLIGQQIDKIKHAVIDPITNLASELLQAGANAIQMFINGMLSKLGAIKDAAGNLVHGLTSFLGFHSPTEEGPGAEADVWGPNLVQMFADGMHAKMPVAQHAAKELAAMLDDTLGAGLQKRLFPTSAAGELAGAQLGGDTLSNPNAGGTHFHGDINLTIPVESSEEDDGAPPEQIGERFGRSTAQHFTDALIAHGYRRS